MRTAMGVESLRMSLDCRRIGPGIARSARNPDYRTGGTPLMTRM